MRLNKPMAGFLAVLTMLSAPTYLAKKPNSIQNKKMSSSSKDLCSYFIRGLKDFAAFLTGALCSNLFGSFEESLHSNSKDAVVENKEGDKNNGSGSDDGGDKITDTGFDIDAEENNNGNEYDREGLLVEEEEEEDEAIYDGPSPEANTILNKLDVPSSSEFFTDEQRHGEEEGEEEEWLDELVDLKNFYFQDRNSAYLHIPANNGSEVAISKETLEKEMDRFNNSEWNNFRLKNFSLSGAKDAYVSTKNLADKNLHYNLLLNWKNLSDMLKIHTKGLINEKSHGCKEFSMMINTSYEILNLIVKKYPGLDDDKGLTAFSFGWCIFDRMCGIVKKVFQNVSNEPWNTTELSQNEFCKDAETTIAGWKKCLK